MKMESGMREISLTIEPKEKEKYITMMAQFIEEFSKTTSLMEEEKKLMRMDLGFKGNSYKGRRDKVSSTGQMDQNT